MHTEAMLRISTEKSNYSDRYPAQHKIQQLAQYLLIIVIYCSLSVIWVEFNHIFFYYLPNIGWVFEYYFGWFACQDHAISREFVKMKFDVLKRIFQIFKFILMVFLYDLIVFNNLLFYLLLIRLLTVSSSHVVFDSL